MPSPLLAYPLAVLYGTVLILCDAACVGIALAFMAPFSLVALAVPRIRARRAATPATMSEPVPARPAR